MKAAKAIPAEPMSVNAAIQRVDEISQALTRAQSELMSLEQRRGQIVLSGGDVDAFHLDLFKANENAKTLGAGLEAAQAALADAQERKLSADLEARNEQINTEHAPALAGANRRLFEALRAVTAAAAEIAASRIEIEHNNSVLANHGRPDLVVPIDRIIESAVRQLAGGVATDPARAAVVRQGETDEEFFARINSTLQQRAHALPRRGEKSVDFERRLPGVAFAKRAFVEPGKGEDADTHLARQIRATASDLNLNVSEEETTSTYHRRVWLAAAKKLAVVRNGETDESYQRRLLRQRAKEDDLVAATNPLRDVGFSAIEAIQEHALGMGPDERRRAFPKPVVAASRQSRGINHADDLVQYGQRYIRNIRALRG